jgi:hypothetical protein
MSITLASRLIAIFSEHTKKNSKLVKCDENKVLLIDNVTFLSLIGMSS